MWRCPQLCLYCSLCSGHREGCVLTLSLELHFQYLLWVWHLLSLAPVQLIQRMLTCRLTETAKM